MPCAAAGSAPILLAALACRVPSSATTSFSRTASCSTWRRWRILVLLLGYTGLRWGEATALRVCDIDLDRRRIDVRRAFSDVGGRIVIGTPKSHQSRTVPIPRFLAVEIGKALEDKRPDDLAFTASGGTLVRLSNWRRAVFLPARCQAGLSSRFRIHDLRHTAASLM